MFLTSFNGENTQTYAETNADLNVKTPRAQKIIEKALPSLPLRAPGVKSD
jgi:hypothetical protein